MHFRRTNVRIFSIMLIFSILFAPLAIAQEKASMWDRMKDKTNKKVEEVQQKEWWVKKAFTKVVSFVGGKAGGLIGGGIGFLIGTSLGGPLAAGAGATIGFRIGDQITKIFARGIGQFIAEKHYDKEKTLIENGKSLTFETVKNAFKSVNYKSLSAESTGAVIGDLIGGTLGAAAGIALLAGTGTWAFPLIGTFSAAYLGSKLGGKIGRGICRWIGKKVFKKSYEAFAPEDTENETEAVVDGEIAQTEQEATDDPFGIQVPVKDSSDTAIDDEQILNSSADDMIRMKRIMYEEAYQEYTRLTTSPGASAEEVKETLARYREAYEAYKAAVAAKNQNSY